MTRAAESERRPISLALVAQGTLVIIGLWALASAVWLSRDVVFIAFFAVLVASFLSLFVDPLVELGAKRPLAVGIVLLTLLGLAVATALLVWPVLQQQAALVQRELPRLLDRVQQAITNQTEALGVTSPGGSGVEQQLQSRVRSELASLIGGTLPLLNTALGFVTGLALVVAAGSFLALEPRTYVNGLVRLVPNGQRERIRAVLPIAGRSLRQWIKGTAIGMLVVGGASTLGLTLIGVPAALALGLLAGLLEFIPYVGPAASFVPAIGVALTVSTSKAIYVVLLYLGIQFFESYLLIPLLMRGMVRLPPALTLLFQSVMAGLFGFLGLLLATPALAFGKVLVQQLYVEPVADES